MANEEDKENIIIRFPNGSKFAVRVGLSATVADFKRVLAQKCYIPSDHQILIYKGLILNNYQTLDNYGVQADHTVHMVARITSKPLAATGAVPGSEQFVAGFPGSEQLLQQLVTQNPNVMRALMNTLVIHGLMNNPDLVLVIIMDDPRMRDTIEANSELDHVLNNFSTFQETVEAVRKPTIMREMTRIMDVEMSIIESSPEGFNALRRMYEKELEQELELELLVNASETRSDPLLGGGGAQTSDGSNNPSNVVFETSMGSAIPNSNPLPNPWGAPQDNTTAISNSTGDATIRLPDMDGWEELDYPEVVMGKILQNSAVSQMMQNMLCNPQYINQVLNSDPLVRHILDMDPQLRELMQNQDFLMRLFSSETRKQLYKAYYDLMAEREALEAEIEALEAEHARLLAENEAILRAIAELVDPTEAGPTDPQG